MRPPTDVRELVELAEARICADPAAATGLVDRLLGPLLAYDGVHHGDLVRTVAVLAGCGWSSAAAARRLFILRNSVLYRRARIEEITGLTLADADTRFALDLAVRLHRRLMAMSPPRQQSPKEDDP